MKNLLLLFTLIFSSAALADGELEFGRGQHKFSDPDVADVTVVMADIGETRDVLNVFIKCRDKRLRPNAVKPRLEQFIFNDLPNKPVQIAVCAYRPEGALDTVNKRLHIRYSIMRTLPNKELECGGDRDHDRRTIVDLRAWCYAFQPPN